jgi:serine-type D-Ala-D-Ala carboxypeptidase/endopeptidase
MPTGLTRRDAVARVATTLTCAGPAFAAPQDARLSAPQNAPLSAALDEIVAQRGLSGAGAQIFSNGKLIHESTAGDFTPQKVVSIASSSKWLTVATILTVVDEGRLSLDDRVAKYVPAFGDDKRDMTLRHCLSCTSGLASRVPGVMDVDMTMAECVGRIATLPLQERPGTKLRYGGTGFQVGAHLAELVTGKSWYALFAERIKDPLDMSHTEFGLISEEDGRELNFGGGNKLRADGSRTRNPWVAGTAVSSMSDYGRLVQMFAAGGVFGGRRLVSAAMVAEMFTEQTTGMAIGFSAYPNDPSIRYGLGTWIERRDAAGRSLSVSDGGAFGWMPFVEFDSGICGVVAVKDRLRNVLASIDRFRALARVVSA